MKEVFEETLLARVRDLFTELDLVFLDTTSLYFTRQDGQTIRHFGSSKDRRPYCHQLVLGLVLNPG